ncbi:MAG: beta strand repeat-containing protein, partial [Limisphaerales bacterium]
IMDGGHNTTVSGPISGPGGLTKIGTGTGTLMGVNTFGGNITISNGTLAISGAGQLGGGAYSGSIADSGTLTYDSAAAQTLSGTISGTGALNQNGSGQLTLSGNNTFSGATTVAGGTVQLANPLALQGSTLNYNNQGGTLNFGSLTAATLGGLSGAQNLSLQNGPSAAVALTVDGNNSSTTYSGVLSGAGASLIKSGSGTLILTGNNSYSGATTVSNGVLQLNAGGVINGAAANVVDGAAMTISGGSLTASASSNIGAGAAAALLVSAGSATYNGGLTTDLGNDDPILIEVTGGNLTAASLALGRSGFISSTLPTSGSTADGLYVKGGTVNITGNLDMSSSGSANSTASARMDSGSLDIGGTVTIGLKNSGRWSVLDVNGGALSVTDTTTGISVGGPNPGNAELLIRNGTATIGRIGLGYGTIADAAVLNLRGGSLYVGAGGIVQVSSSVTPTNMLAGGLLGAATNWSSSMPMILEGATIQAGNALGNAQNISLSGVLSGANLIKTGSGTLTLSGTNTFTGTTTISGGALLANTANRSATGTNDVVVASGGTLGGTGIISGAVTVNSGGALAPGNAPATLTISNNLTLAAGSTTFMQVQHSPLTNTAVKVTGTLTNGGTLNVTNSSGAAPANGDSFKLFNAATYSGSFSSLVLPSLPAGLGWNTNGLNSAGTLSVVINARSVMGGFSISGSSLVFTGSGGVANANYYLLGTTNLAKPLTKWTRLMTNQFDNKGNFNFTNTLDTNSFQDFYLLQLQ